MRLPFGIFVSSSSIRLLAAGCVVCVLGATSCSGTAFTADPSAGSGGTLAAGGVSGAGHVGHAGHGGAALPGAGASSVPGGGMNSSPEAGSADGGALGLAGETATGGVSSAGAAGAAGDAGSGGESGACSLRTWFADDDKDGFGRGTSIDVDCEMPPQGSWSRKAGDCNDDDKGVYPTEQAFHAEGYTVGSGTSFDYDCSGKEEADPSQLAAAPACASLGVFNCSGSGFASTGRTGDGVNPICGSKTLVKCAQSGLACAAVTSQVPDGVRCR